MQTGIQSLDIPDFTLDIALFAAEVELPDSDGDGIGDNADPDDDGDGYSDAEETDAGTNPLDRLQF